MITKSSSISSRLVIRNLVRFGFGCGVEPGVLVGGMSRANVVGWAVEMVLSERESVTFLNSLLLGVGIGVSNGDNSWVLDEISSAVKVSMVVSTSMLGTIFSSGAVCCGLGVDSIICGISSRVN